MSRPPRGVQVECNAPVSSFAVRLERNTAASGAAPNAAQAAEIVEAEAANRTKQEAERLANVRTTTKIGVGVALAYSLSYFWRYPIFILPKEILNQHVATVFGTKLDLQACLSMAFILGFGAAKAPMAAFVSSPTFFRRRLATLTTMLITSMLLEGVGIWAFAAHPPLQVVCVFLSSFISSGLYGACYGAYLEGRRSTETLLAIVSGFLIYAGNLARGCASWVLSLGVPPDLMPLAIGAVHLMDDSTLADDVDTTLPAITTLCAA